MPPIGLSCSYAADNNSYGLTTLRNKHAKVNGSDICFRFRGKSGQPHDFCITDAGLAEIVRRCQDLPGQELFGYVDECGQVQDVDSGDVNEYLREIAGQEFSAKDFRTWGGSVTGLEVLRQLGPATSQVQAKRNVIAAVKTAAERLNNRPATCRKFYVHPQVINAYTEGRLHDILARADAKYNASRTHSLRRDEAALLYLLQQGQNGKSLRRAARQAAKVC